MNQVAEELHKESLEILAKLASSAAVKLNENKVNNHKIASCLKSSKTSNFCSSCYQEQCNGTCDKENITVNNIHGTVTPQKQRIVCDPVTPTANLKMLVCAASVLTPASPNNIQEEKRNLFTHSTFKENYEIPDIQPKINILADPKSKKGQQLLGRKEKSLGLLCKR